MADYIQEKRDVRIGTHTVSLTSLSKPLWPQKNITKARFLQYLQDISPYFLPFLQYRLLTSIRYPHGVGDDFFYQKNCPDYAPSYIQRHKDKDITYIVCSDLTSLIWLGNQLTLEFHIPFQTIHTSGPSEIVFDLDPPSRQEFSLAIEAALAIKEVLDRLNLYSFIKTSGNKGLQLYIPLPDHQFSYDDTRRFTQFIAHYLVNKEPNWFTVERLKAKRGKKLYVDYVQHAAGKTIIAPYSPRGNKDALVATPLFWKEVNSSLSPDPFSLENIVQRVKSEGCPFEHFFAQKTKQPFQPVLRWLKEQNV
ncbi:non-homologous end-joining DNA ligase [Bacillus horti]|uniref:DNA ligase D n=1 Tax=Caldalkalibacillus horti TaxID=77523 RepID=A0ABT9VXE5_9BACI|nr:non-homologous end-joining DNA ligase [Bacillus horti]MDQ0165668.1 DNA ligase D [Bacillus horti]